MKTVSGSILIAMLILPGLLSCEKNGSDKQHSGESKPLEIDSGISDSAVLEKTVITIDTSSAKHTIIIENVKDPRELQQILSILESYSSENSLSGLDIKYIKTEQEIEPEK